MNRNQRQQLSAMRSLAVGFVAGGAMTLASIAWAQEESMPPEVPQTDAPDTVSAEPAAPETTMRRTTEPSVSPPIGEEADPYRVQRDRETDESGTVVREPGRGEDPPLSTDSIAQEGVGYDENSALKDAWLDGKLEASFALNRHLSAFAIDTDVEDGMVHLTGEVDSEIDRNLATEVAQNIEGVTGVRNDLTVQPDGRVAAADAGGERSFAERVGDATTTATVKSKLLIDDKTQGLKINVTTLDHVVTLTGDVDSTEEKRLAEQIAGNVDEVERVQNELNVVQTSEEAQ